MDDSWPMSFAKTVEEMPRSIIREANAWRIEWNETPVSPAFFAATANPLPVAPRWPSGRPDLEANTGSSSLEYLDAGE